MNILPRSYISSHLSKILRPAYTPYSASLATVNSFVVCISGSRYLQGGIPYAFLVYKKFQTELFSPLRFGCCCCCFKIGHSTNPTSRRCDWFQLACVNHRQSPDSCRMGPTELVEIVRFSPSQTLAPLIDFIAITYGWEITADAHSVFIPSLNRDFWIPSRCVQVEMLRRQFFETWQLPAGIKPVKVLSKHEGLEVTCMWLVMRISTLNFIDWRAIIYSAHLVLSMVMAERTFLWSTTQG